jgi:hypothetical protein
LRTSISACTPSSFFVNVVSVAAKTGDSEFDGPSNQIALPLHVCDSAVRSYVVASARGVPPSAGTMYRPCSLSQSRASPLLAAPVLVNAIHFPSRETSGP